MMGGNFFALVRVLTRTGVFIRPLATFVEMVRGRPTVLRLLAQCTMEIGASTPISVHVASADPAAVGRTARDWNFLRHLSPMAIVWLNHATS
jgi:hypothetical protein